MTSGGAGQDAICRLNEQRCARSSDSAVPDHRVDAMPQFMLGFIYRAWSNQKTKVDMLQQILTAVTQ